MCGYEIIEQLEPQRFKVKCIYCLKEFVRYKCAIKQNLHGCDSCARWNAPRSRPRHGHGTRKKTKIYRAWQHMKSRCGNPSDPRYSSYGGRGIDYDPRYESFDIFLAEIGEPSSQDLSIDRIDNDRGYWKDNIRWTTMHEQYRNRRNNRFFTFDGKTLCASDWARELRINHGSFMKRIRKHGISDLAFRQGAER